MDPRFSPLLRAAARPYLRAGIYPWQFARWKLRLDPVFLALMHRGLLPDRGRLLDLGCGQGVLLALLVAAREEYRCGRWPQDWPAPPLNLELAGVERSQGPLRVARRAFGDAVRFEQCDARHAGFPRCSAITALDVLLYLGREDQEGLLEKAAGALETGGLLLLREANAEGGLAFQVTRWSARLSGLVSGRIWPEVHCRSAGDWTRILEALGFSVDAEPMSMGTPFANVLFVARKKT